MWWSLKTDVGTFSIKPVGRKFVLFVDDKPLGTPQHTPDLAAHDVEMCATGHQPWDDQEAVGYPRNLDDWQKHR